MDYQQYSFWKYVLSHQSRVQMSQQFSFRPAVSGSNSTLINTIYKLRPWLYYHIINLGTALKSVLGNFLISAAIGYLISIILNFSLFLLICVQCRISRCHRLYDGEVVGNRSSRGSICWVLSVHHHPGYKIGPSHWSFFDTLSMRWTLIG